MLFMNAPAAVETAMVEAVAENAASFTVDPMNFVKNLSYMGTGMLGIFIVMGSIILSTFILNKVCNRKPKNDDAE